MKDMTKKQAAQWVEQEMAKITTVDQAKVRMASIDNSRNGFWQSPAGVAAGKAAPNGRQAQVDLYARLEVFVK